MSDPGDFRHRLGVYLVTEDPGAAPDRPSEQRLDAVVVAAVRGGAGVVQLRAKSATTVWRAATVRRWRELLPAGTVVVVNDDVAAAAQVPGVGVHVGPDDPHPTAVRAELGPDVCLGWSLHEFAQCADLDALAAVDYVAVSPVWATATKTDTTSPWGLAGVRRLRAALPARLPLVGIGGIGPDTAADVIRAGADGVAVVSAICAAADPSAAAARLRTAVDEVRR